MAFTGRGTGRFLSTILRQVHRRAYSLNKGTQKIILKDYFLHQFRDELSKGKVVSATQATHFIKSCSQDIFGENNITRNDLLQYVWGELEKNGVQFDTAMWNVFLSVYVENRLAGLNFEPLDFLKEMREKSNIDPNETTFCLLIQAYAVKGEPVGVKQVLKFMKNQVKITGDNIYIMYGWLIMALVKCGDMKGVQEIFEALRKNDIKLSDVVYGPLISAHAQLGDLESLENTFLEMIQDNVHPTAQIYVDLLEHLTIGGHTHLIDKVWSNIEDNERLADDIEPLIRRCLIQGDYDAAHIMLKNTKICWSKRDHYGMLYDFLIRGYSYQVGPSRIVPLQIEDKDKENASNVVHIHAEMTEKRLKPIYLTSHEIIYSHLLLSDIDGAMKALAKFAGIYKYKKEDFSNFARFFIRAYVVRNEISKAEELFDKMRVESEKTFSQYNNMMQVCSEYTGNITKVEDVYEEMLLRGFTPSVYTFMHRIYTCLRANKPEQCISVLEENIASGKYFLRASTIISVLWSLVQAGDVENVTKVCEWIGEYHPDVDEEKHINNSKLFVNINAGNFEDALAFLNKSTDIDYLDSYLLTAKDACTNGNADFIKNMIDFLKLNDMSYQILDNLYLQALNKIDNIDGIQHFYKERMSGLANERTFDKEFMGLLESIIVERGMENFIEREE